MTTCWESRDSRVTLGGVSASWPTDHLAVCAESAPVPDAECSREEGHQGRHMASLGPGWGHRVVVAWPGTHRPCKADLTGPWPMYRHTVDNDEPEEIWVDAYGREVPCPYL
jgi:hypothetical protein